MVKHIVAPATAEQIARTLGVTREDREIVDRILRELGEYEIEQPSTPPNTGGCDAAPIGDPSPPRKHK